MSTLTCTCCAATGRHTSIPRDFTIEVGSRRYRFEMHPISGPAVLDRMGEIACNQPGPRSHFWAAVTAWCQQGRTISHDGTCVWDHGAGLRQ